MDCSVSWKTVFTACHHMYWINSQETVSISAFVTDSRCYLRCRTELLNASVSHH